jgi:hypothetical protein
MADVNESGVSYYLYLPDSFPDLIYCSRCGIYPFIGFDRREPHQKWLEVIQAHTMCSRDNPGPGEFPW